MSTSGLKWKRRVTKIHNSFFISIPLIWAESKGISKGNELTVVLQPDGSLVISREEEHE